MKISEKAHSWVLDDIQQNGSIFFTGALLLLLVYIQHLPQRIPQFIQTPYGSIIGLLFVFAITRQFGWPQGILTGLAFVLLLSDYTIHGPIKKGEGFQEMKAVNEGFHDITPAMYPTASLQKVFLPDKHRWFIERITGETPLLIEENIVKTHAVQDNSQHGNGSVQNSSVQSM